MGGAPGNRQDNRGRGNAPQMLEKYKALARDAQQAGDRVQTEYYLQFADHYFRVVSETRSRYEEPRRAREDAEDYDDEGVEDGVEDEVEVRAERPQRDYRDRDDRPQRADRPREDRPREDRQREMAREDRPQREERAGREDRPRDDRPRDDRPLRADRPRRYRDEDRAPAYAEAANGGAANGQEEDDGPRLDLDRLPPAIPRPVLSDGEDADGAEIVANQDEDGDDRPRRARRPRRPREGAPVAA